VGCSGVVELLVRWALQNEHIKILAVYMYYVENRSPSEIATAVHYPRLAVRGWVQRLKEKCNGPDTRVSKVVRLAFPIVFALPPAAKGKRVDPGTLRKVTREVLEELRKILSANPRYFQHFQIEKVQVECRCT